MKILLRLPTWIGDAVMTTPTIQALNSYYPQAEFSLVGSPSSIELFSKQSLNAKLFVDESKKAKNRYLSLYQIAQKIGKHDLALTFQNNFPSALLLFLTKSTQRIGYAKNLRSFLLTSALKPQPTLHQVEQYLHLLSPLHIPLPSKPQLQLDCKTQKRGKKTRIGINAGAKYGSAKRWCESYFIEVIASLLKEDYEVILYGGRDEIEANTRIAQALQHIAPLQNFINLTAKTDLPSLIDHIASLDLFITNDSGPMHIASSQNIPLIAIFGPTQSKETSPYNSQSPVIILDKHLPCSPCKKRECPLKHHQCMKLITPDEVLNNVDQILKA